jgi:hypothetical protein
MANPGDDVYGVPEHLAFRDTVRRFVQTELAPRAREFDQMGRIDKSLYGRWASSGCSASATASSTAVRDSTTPIRRSFSRRSRSATTPKQVVAKILGI